MRRLLFAIAAMLPLTLPAPARAICETELSHSPVVDCSGIYGGDGAPLTAQLEQPTTVMLRSIGSDDSRTGFAGSGGSIEAVVALPSFDATLTLAADGGDSSGFDTGGRGGDLNLTVNGGRNVDNITLTTNGGRNVSERGADGAAGDVILILDGVAVKSVVVSADGARGGAVRISLINGASVETLTVSAKGHRLPGQIWLELDAETRIGSLVLSAREPLVQPVGDGEIESVIIQDNG